MGPANVQAGQIEAIPRTSVGVACAQYPSESGPESPYSTFLFNR